MALRLLVPDDEALVPSLTPNELGVGPKRPRLLGNERDGSPGFTGSMMQAKQVAELTALGLPVDKVAQILHISIALLEFYYEHELQISESMVNAGVAKVAHDMAISGRHPEMTQFWLKHRAGWSEKSRIEVSGPDGRPLEIREARESLMKAIVDHETSDDDVEDAEIVSDVPAEDVQLLDR